MALLTREKVLRQRNFDLPFEAVPCPEWDDDPEAFVNVRGFTADENRICDARFGWAKKNETIAEREGRLKGSSEWAAATCCVDDAGKAIFTPFDVDALGKLSARPIERIWSVVARLSGRTEESRKELEKNSETTPACDGSPGAPLNGAAHPAKPSAAAEVLAT